MLVFLFSSFPQAEVSILWFLLPCVRGSLSFPLFGALAAIDMYSDDGVLLRWRLNPGAFLLLGCGETGMVSSISSLLLGPWRIQWDFLATAFWLKAAKLLLEAVIPLQIQIGWETLAEGPLGGGEREGRSSAPASALISSCPDPSLTLSCLGDSAYFRQKCACSLCCCYPSTGASLQSVFWGWGEPREETKPQRPCHHQRSPSSLSYFCAPGCRPSIFLHHLVSPAQPAGEMILILPITKLGSMKVTHSPRSRRIWTQVCVAWASNVSPTRLLLPLHWRKKPQHLSVPMQSLGKAKGDPNPQLRPRAPSWDSRRILIAGP